MKNLKSSLVAYLGLIIVVMFALLLLLANIPRGGWASAGNPDNNVTNPPALPAPPDDRVPELSPVTVALIASASTAVGTAIIAAFVALMVFVTTFAQQYIGGAPPTTIKKAPNVNRSKLSNTVNAFPHQLRQILRTKGPILVFADVLLVGATLLILGVGNNLFPEELLSFGILLIILLGCVAMATTVVITSILEQKVYNRRRAYWNTHRAAHKPQSR